jgi:L-xylulokinase
MDSHHTKAHIMRAVYEGVVFCHLEHIEKLLRTRAKPNVVRLAGGVANSDVWVQIFADVLNLPIEIIDTRELGAMGCAMAAGVASGEFGNLKEAAKAMVRVKKRFAPNIDLVPVYERKYAQYKKVSSAVESCWQ